MADGWTVRTSARRVPTLGLWRTRGDVDMDEAVAKLRRAARRTNSLLVGIARDLVEGRLEASALLSETSNARGT